MINYKLNFVDRFLLWLVLLPKGLYKNLGVDTFQLRTLLRMKLIVSNRQPTPMQEMQANKKKKTNSNLSIVLIALLTGFFTSFVFFITDDLKFKLIIFFTMYCLMLGMSLVMDFSSTLTDEKELLLLSRPVHSRTYTLSRILYALIQILKTAIPLGLPAAIILTVQSEMTAGIMVLFFLLIIILALLFIIQSLYLLLLRIVPAAKVKRAVMVLQIIFGMLIFAMSQFVPRLMDMENNPALKADNYPWLKFYPLYPYAVAIESIASGNFSLKNIVIIILCVLIPLLCFIFLIRYLGGYYTGKLAVSFTAEKKKTPAKSGNGFPDIAAKLLVRDKQEKAGFLFAWIVASRLREYNLKVYPFFGYVLVMMALPFLRKFTDPARYESRSHIGNQYILWIGIYLLSIMGFVIYSNLTFAEKYKGSWFWQTSPVEKPGPVIAGAFKAVFLKFNLLFIIPFLIAGIIKMDPMLLLNQLLAIANLVVVSALVMMVTGRQLPFSKPNPANQSEGCLKMVVSMFVFLGAAVLGIFQYFIVDKWWALLLFTFISVVAAWWIIAEIKNTSWAKLKSTGKGQEDELA